MRRPPRRPFVRWTDGILSGGLICLCGSVLMDRGLPVVGVRLRPDAGGMWVLVLIAALVGGVFGLSAGVRMHEARRGSWHEAEAAAVGGFAGAVAAGHLTLLWRVLSRLV